MIVITVFARRFFSEIDKLATKIDFPHSFLFLSRFHAGSIFFSGVGLHVTRGSVHQLFWQLFKVEAHLSHCFSPINVFLLRQLQFLFSSLCRVASPEPPLCEIFSYESSEYWSHRRFFTQFQTPSLLIKREPRLLVSVGLGLGLVRDHVFGLVGSSLMRSVLFLLVRRGILFNKKPGAQPLGLFFESQGCSVFSVTAR